VFWVKKKNGLKLDNIDDALSDFFFKPNWGGCKNINKGLVVRAMIK
jgi:hypothetical protein